MSNDYNQVSGVQELQNYILSESTINRFWKNGFKINGIYGEMCNSNLIWFLHIINKYKLIPQLQ